MSGQRAAARGPTRAEQEALTAGQRMRRLCHPRSPAAPIFSPRCMPVQVPIILGAARLLSGDAACLVAQADFLFSSCCRPWPRAARARRPSREKAPGARTGAGLPRALSTPSRPGPNWILPRPASWADRARPARRRAQPSSPIEGRASRPSERSTRRRRRYQASRCSCVLLALRRTRSPLSGLACAPCSGGPRARCRVTNVGLGAAGASRTWTCDRGCRRRRTARAGARRRGLRPH
jgi:hypothetical protein